MLLLLFVNSLGDVSFSELSKLWIYKLNTLTYPKCHLRGKGMGEGIKAGERHRRAYTTDTGYYSY